MFDRRIIHWPIETLVRPAKDADSAPLERIIEELTADHPWFVVYYDFGSPLVFVGGCDERHLLTNLALLKSKVHFEDSLDALQVGYREIITKSAISERRHDEVEGEEDQFAYVKLAINPLDTKLDFQFENRVDTRLVPEDIVPGIVRGIRDVLDGGVFSFRPMIGMRIVLLDGAYGGVRPSVSSFEVASWAALTKAAREANPILSEPILRIKVVAPNGDSDAIVAELKSRRGEISSIVVSNKEVEIVATVPVALFFGYENSLASLSGGRASYESEISHYARVPSMGEDDPTEPATAALRA